MAVLMLVSIPMYPSVSLLKKLGDAESEGQVIRTALSSDRVRGHQREFLSQLELVMDIDEEVHHKGKIPLPVSVVAPAPVQEALEEKLADHAIAPASPDCVGCVRLEWVEMVGWNYRVVPSSRSETVESALAGLSIDELEGRLESFIREGLILLPGPPEIILDPEQAYEAMAEGFVLSARFGTHMMLLFVFLLFPLVAGGTVGLSWERKRRSSALEPLVFTHHPPWVAYLGEIIREAGFIVPVMLGSLAVVWVYSLPVHWPFLLALLPFGLSLYVLSSVWGLLATVLFHHPQGRMLSKLALSPLFLGVVWALRLTMLWAAMKAFRPISFISQAESILQSSHLLLLAIPPMLALTWVLALLVNKRMGRRREGLRETKLQ